MPRKPKEENLELATSIGKQIELAMLALKMSVSDLHKATGISRTVLLAYTRGGYAPGARELKLLCEHLQVTPNILLYGSNDIAPSPYKLGDISVSNAHVGNFATLALLSHCTQAERNALLTLLEGLVQARDPSAHRETLDSIQALMGTVEGQDFITSIAKKNEAEFAEKGQALADILNSTSKKEKPQK